MMKRYAVPVVVEAPGPDQAFDTLVRADEAFDKSLHFIGEPMEVEEAAEYESNPPHCGQPVAVAVGTDDGGGAWQREQDASGDPCPACRGKGTIELQTDPPTVDTCPRCGGSGTK